MSAELATHDICLLPVPTNEVTRHKSSNRPVLALRHGLAVVADRLPSYEELAPYVTFVNPGGWEDAVVRYAEDPALRRRHAAEGRDHVRSTHTAERTVAQWSGALRMVLDAESGS